MRMDRRRFITSSLGIAGVAALGAPAVLGQAKPKVVVVGAGAGGATAAKYIAKDSGGAIDVTLVEENANYRTCFHSNLYIGGLKDYDGLTHSYDGLAKQPLKMARARATGIDRDKREVTLSSGERLAYDRLILSPGIDLRYDSVPGWSKAAEEAMPHGWRPGRQSELIKQKLDATPNGGLIVMIAPPTPYRCPPGPYERVSMFAHALTKAGKKDCKIIILDPKETFSKQAAFLSEWQNRYGKMIEWLSPKIYNAIEAVEPETGTVRTGFETYEKCALVNVIPAQMAAAITRDAGLAPATGYCAIDAASMRSAVDQNIFIVGDAAIAGDMPKSAFAANNQAKVAAMLVRADLTGSRQFPARYANTCWSAVDAEAAIKIGGRYEAKDGKITATETYVSSPGESAEVRKKTEEENVAWYQAITTDMFA